MTSISRHAAFVIGAAMLVAAAGIGAHAQGQAAGGPGGQGFGRRGGPGAMGRGGPMGPGGAVDLPLAQLTLTAQQRDQVKTILDSNQDELKTLAEREMAARKALDASIAAAPIDEGAIRQAAANLGLVEADAAVERANIRAQVFQLLTPDQQKQALAIEAAGPPQGRGKRK